MSSTKRGRERNRADDYPTPSWCVRRFLEVVPLPAGRWLEPCGGEGNIIKNVTRSDVQWTAVEIREEAARKLASYQLVTAYHCDFLNTAWGPQHWDVVLTNPPFALAIEFVQSCLKLSTHVVMLLRLNFLASEERAAFMRASQPDVYVLPNRPSFFKKEVVSKLGKHSMRDVTDSIEYAWFHWHPHAQGIVRVLASTPKEERDLG